MSNTYKLSDGTRLSKDIINARIKRAKKQVLDNQLREHGYNFCSQCKRSSGVYFDCSHIISTDDCQKSGRSELAYDIDNIEVLCRGCHQRRDLLDLKFNEV